MKSTKKLNKQFKNLISDYKNVKIHGLYDDKEFENSCVEYELNAEFVIEVLATQQLESWEEFDGMCTKVVHYEIHDIIEIGIENDILILNELEKLEIIDLFEKLIKIKLNLPLKTKPITKKISIEEKLCDSLHADKEEIIF